jgi:hypothetical protein
MEVGQGKNVGCSAKGKKKLLVNHPDYNKQQNAQNYIWSRKNN